MIKKRKKQQIFKNREVLIEELNKDYEKLKSRMAKVGLAKSQKN